MDNLKKEVVPPVVPPVVQPKMIPHPERKVVAVPEKKVLTEKDKIQNLKDTLVYLRDNVLQGGNVAHIQRIDNALKD